MAATARANRQSAPQADTTTDVPVTPALPIWKRITNTVKRGALAVRGGAVTAAKTLAKPFKAIARKVKPALKTASSKVAPVARRLWTRVLQPFLFATLAITALFTLFVAAAVAPLTTALVMVGGAVLAFAASFGIAALENREKTGSRAARITLNVLNAIAWVFVGFAYGVAAIFLVTMCAASAAFTVFLGVALVLAYFEVKGAVSIAFVVWCALTGNWALGLVCLLVYALRHAALATEKTETQAPPQANTRTETKTETKIPVDVRPMDAPNNPETWTRGNFFVAKGTEELWGTEHDVAPVPEVCECGVCNECHAKLVESEHVFMWDVSKDKRPCDMRLTPGGFDFSVRESLEVEERTWVVTAQHRDTAGKVWGREWVCLEHGTEVAKIVDVFNRERHAFDVYVMGVRYVTKTGVKAAKRAATDELDAQRNTKDNEMSALDAARAVSDAIGANTSKSKS